MENPNLNKPLYSIIILIFHRTPELVEMAKECLGSVKANSKDCEIILVDNGSTERFEWEKHVDTYVRLDENKGISRGWNTGLKLARGKFKVILGDDVTVMPGYLEGLREAIEMPQAGMANIHVEHLPHGKGIVENYKWLSGACFMLTQKTIDRIGYFDETIFPANTEDWDYWTRILRNGMKIYVNYQVSVMHKEGQTVHAPDISEHTQRLLKQFEAKHGFDPVPVFCSDKNFPF